MGSLNKVQLIGKLGADPEIKYTPSGTAVCNFNLATDESYTDKQGKKHQKTEWHRIVAWGKLAEICGEYLHKGKEVYVEGKLQTRSWEDREGNKKYTTEVVLPMFGGVMQMLGPNTKASKKNDSSGGPFEEAFGQGGPVDDDIPF